MTWYQLKRPEKVASPGLLVYPERIAHNINEMIRVAGSADRLRPHVKTHKCREIVRLQQKAGIQKFKCATIAEAEMLAECQAKDVLLAYQPTGPNANRYLNLTTAFPETSFSTLVDNLSMAEHLNQISSSVGSILGVFIDMDAGMHRTGISPGPEVLRLEDSIRNAENLKFCGWHVYDGHIRHSDIEQRSKAVELSFNSVLPYISTDSSLEIVAGGSPTFPVHALNPRVNLSPGTSLLWDQQYHQTLSDQNFLIAAVLLTRIVSKPGEDLICLDIGHKALASEMTHPRAFLPELGQVEFKSHSEEHLVISTEQASDFQVGDVLYAFPMHICPTTALHQELIVIENGLEIDRWQVYARDRRINA